MWHRRQVRPQCYLVPIRVAFDELTSVTFSLCLLAPFERGCLTIGMPTSKKIPGTERVCAFVK